MTDTKEFAVEFSEGKDWREPGVCRCCLSRGVFQSMDVPYWWQGNQENYTDMLRITFQITLGALEKGGITLSRLICESCVLRLRDAHAFWCQVQNSESSLLNQSNQVSVKVEPKEDPDLEQKHTADNFDDDFSWPESDDDAPLSAVKMKSEKPVKMEVYLEEVKNIDPTQDEQEVCPECNATLTSHEELMHHLRTDHGKGNQICDKCQKCFQYASAKRAHMRKVHGVDCAKNPVYRCKKCNLDFANHQEKAAHIKVKHRQCELCDRTFQYTYEKERHMRGTHGMKSDKFFTFKAMIECKKCNLEFATDEQRQEHLKEKHETCDLCQKSFEYHNHKVKHMSDEHGIKCEKAELKECLQCCIKFPTHEEMQKHVEEKHRHCEICNKRFKYPNQKSKHMKEEHDIEKEVFKCKKCKVEFPTDEERQRHMKENHFQCEGCQKFFQSKKTKNQHMREEHRIECNKRRAYECKVCGVQFPTNKERQDHIKQTHHRCELCEKRFKHLVDRVRHMSREHGIEPKKRKDYDCKKCKIPFKTFREKELHLKEVHKPSCPHCSETFPTYHHRKQHLYTVHGVKKEVFPCGVCNRVYDTRTRLQQHQRNVHMGERNFACSQCSATFFSDGKLKRHMVRHGEYTQIYECEFCRKKFPRKNTLLYHRRIHTGDKRMVCKICGAAFVQTASLKYHMTRHHPEA